MREKMKAQLMAAFNNPSQKNCTYSFNVEKTASEKLYAVLNERGVTPSSLETTRGME